MTRPPRRLLTDAEKDALLDRQAVLIDALMARIAALEAALAKPRKTSRNSHIPPSQDPGGGSSGDRDEAKPKKRRPSRPGVSRRLAAAPDETIVCRADRCACGADVSGLNQTCRQRYDHVDIPPVLPNVTRVELHGGRCACGKRFRAAPPDGMPAGTPFGPNIHALLAYLHHSHHVGIERLARLAREMFGLTISEGAIANALRRLTTPLEAERAAIRRKLRAAEVVWSDETTTRINGRLHWQWVFVTPEAVLHEIAPRRARAVAQDVMGGHKPAVWVSDRYAGQQEMAVAHQVCLAHVLRDVQYAIDSGDTVFGPALARLLAWTIAIGRRRGELKDSTPAALPDQGGLSARPAAGHTPIPSGRAHLAGAGEGLANQVLHLCPGPAGQPHQQRRRTRNPTLRRVSQGHRRLPIRMGSQRPRRLQIGHQHRSYRWTTSLRHHPQYRRYAIPAPCPDPLKPTT